VTELYADVVGQERAVPQLRSAVPAPVHAYLFVGPPGSGKRAAARSFAASLLCADGGCGHCRDCLLALDEVHPDQAVFERVGPSIDAAQIEEIVRRSVLTPSEGRRNVLVLVDFHLVNIQAPKLLKTIEEPPPNTVFVVLADFVPAELVTIASRCVQIDFGPVPEAVVAGVLGSEGVDAAVAADVAAAAGGRLDRARLLAADPGFAERRATWRNVAARLDGTGAAASVVAAELLELIGSAGVDALSARHEAERSALEERVAAIGARGAGGRQLDERHKREVRRLRMDELRFGLATLQGAYRDGFLAGAIGPSEMVAAVDAIHAAVEALVRNPNESLLLQALLVRLPGLATVAATPE
jgi:DNA polymerase-3 subunit delta'